MRSHPDAASGTTQELPSRRLAFAPVVAIALSLLLRPFALAAPNVGIVAVAVMGDPAPGGGTFGGECRIDTETAETSGFFDEPMVNNKGDVAFGGCVTGGPAVWGYFLKRSGQPIEPVVVAGQVIPGVGTLPSTENDGSSQVFFDGPAVNDLGTVACVVRNISGGTTAALLMKKSGGAVLPVLMQGTAIPKTDITLVDFGDIALNNKDDVAVVATYTVGGGTRTRAGVFLVSHKGKIVVIALNGDVLPGTGGATLGTPDTAPNEDFDAIDGPWLNDKGLVAFQVDQFLTVPPGVDVDSIDESVFAGKKQNGLKPLLMIGERLPDGGQVGGPAFGRPVLNNKGVLAFLTQGRVATKKGKKITVCQVALGDAPGVPGGNFNGTFSAPVIDDLGGVAFFADIVDDSDPPNLLPNGIYRCSGGIADPYVIASEPTKPGGGSWGDLEEISMSGNGHFIVFQDESLATGNAEGVYLADGGVPPKRRALRHRR